MEPALSGGRGRGRRAQRGSKFASRSLAWLWGRADARPLWGASERPIRAGARELSRARSGAQISQARDACRTARAGGRPRQLDLDPQDLALHAAADAEQGDALAWLEEARLAGARESQRERDRADVAERLDGREIALERDAERREHEAAVLHSDLVRHHAVDARNAPTDLCQ